ncbi:MAG: hypothetical protein UV61_C0009G0066 [Candidatus Gottesmanbacteria bacterium GW2011_GWB1_43_11]|uniref:Uncharacterized protein n=1 Tax=Candidatus Gottesmanbacteria bacterium GW2011_GWB1_43_11 TaxID=1618446 RepID=A0A0G1CM01_9BACT|nr:MAG: hypothetical protein UV17_C0013G0005 [Candidatus Gottesmanbacteria bacterium GW2011_GWA1_42_26]KKS86539.1 MAG: hypothetical protein UV61_C0009G0066 [Candidatus Gottesmanbacteria bacterium GW2011_GWB1_43_11]OGG07865.1 MAG: hypothetical protein A2699_02260 [Candidatus Gottesmanbacteria bacterium RIFCSPHIGHO2_01_FULL_43_15]OGG27878.1 MAG: hypothetical protein A3A59_00580 [Candidatus Gottesmanbacteria bacterium RIFCSPLOWO2_01_FULL_42_10]HCM38073.1 hypothetical protein [Patescibacteria group
MRRQNKPGLGLSHKYQLGALQLAPLLLITLFAITTFLIAQRLQTERQELRQRAQEQTCMSFTNQTTCNDTAGCSWSLSSIPQTCTGTPPCQSTSCGIEDVTTTVSCSQYSEAECQSQSGCTLVDQTQACPTGAAEAQCPGGCTKTYSTQTCGFLNGVCPTGCTYYPPQTAACVGPQDCLGLTQTACQRAVGEGCSWRNGTTAICTGSRDIYTGCGTPGQTYVTGTTCEGIHTAITGQSCTGTYYTTVGSCTGNIYTPPNPSPSPILQACAETYAGKCVPNTSICNPSTNYGEAGCGANNKCVVETASCQDSGTTNTNACAQDGATYTSGVTICSGNLLKTCSNGGWSTIDCGVTGQTCDVTQNKCVAPENANQPVPPGQGGPNEERVVFVQNQAECTDKYQGCFNPDNLACVPAWNINTGKCCYPPKAYHDTKYQGMTTSHYENVDSNGMCDLTTLSDSGICVHGSCKKEADASYTCIYGEWMPISNGGSCPPEALGRDGCVHGTCKKGENSQDFTCNYGEWMPITSGKCPNDAFITVESQQTQTLPQCYYGVTSCETYPYPYRQTSGACTSSCDGGICCGGPMVNQGICIPGSTKCVNPAFDSDEVAQIKLCKIDGSGYDPQSISKCNEGQVCNLNQKRCVASIISPPEPVCVKGKTKCDAGKKWTCVDGEWMPNANPGGCSGKTVVPKQSSAPPPVVINNPNCPLKNGVADCKQVGSPWSGNTFPGGCTGEDGKTDTSHNKIQQRGCGQAVTSSVLCTYVGQEYCDVGKVTQELYPFSTCAGTNIFHQENIFESEEFSPYLETEYIRGMITKEKIAARLVDGPVSIAGKFTPFGNTEPIPHISLIVGMRDGKYVFNDPYFTAPKYPNFTDTLEDYMTIEINTALGIKPKKKL